MFAIDGDPTGQERVVAARLLADAARAARLMQVRAETARRDLFVQPEHRLNDRQRAMVLHLLDGLLREIEEDMNGRLADMLDLPLPETAPPVVPADDRLIMIALRTAELHHLETSLLLVAERDGLTGPGFADRLLDHPDNALADAAMAFVVAASHRRDRFGEPVLIGSDLPRQLYHDLIWRAAEAVAARILETTEMSRDAVAEALVEAAVAALGEVSPGLSHGALDLAWQLSVQGELGDRTIVDILLEGRTFLFAAALSVRAESDFDTVANMLADGDASRLCLLLRAANFGESAVAEILSRFYTAMGRTRPEDDRHLELCIAGFPFTTEGEARRALGIGR